MRLHPSATAAGVRLVAHEVLGSTNAEALDLARNGERGPFWVTAARQNAGRGRRGRTWVSPPGNLYASLLLAPPAPPSVWPQLALVAALAVHDAVSECAKPLQLTLAIKWPNDLLLDEAKVAGILVEGESGEAPAVAIGIGVNCVSYPTDTDYPATDLAAQGVTVTSAALFTQLSATMLARLVQWAAGKGFAAVRADWIACATALGEEMRVRLANRELSGRFEAVDAGGNMILRLPDGRAATITAGDTLRAVVSPAREATS